MSLHLVPPSHPTGTSPAGAHERNVHMADPSEPEARPFATWLLEQSGGKTHDELSEALRDLVARVRDTGKKGSVSLTVSVAPMNGDVDVLVVADEIKLRLPEHDRKASLFYPDKDGNLSRRDPNQLTFDSLREVPEGVNPLTGEITEDQK